MSKQDNFDISDNSKKKKKSRKIKALIIVIILIVLLIPSVFVYNYCRAEEIATNKLAIKLSKNYDEDGFYFTEFNDIYTNVEFGFSSFDVELSGSIEVVKYKVVIVKSFSAYVRISPITGEAHISSIYINQKHLD